MSDLQPLQVEIREDATAAPGDLVAVLAALLLRRAAAELERGERRPAAEPARPRKAVRR